MKVFCMIICLAFLASADVLQVESFTGEYGADSLVTSTEIVQVVITEDYLSLKGFDPQNNQVGTSYGLYNVVKAKLGFTAHFMKGTSNYKVTYEMFKRVIIENLDDGSKETYKLRTVNF